MKLKTLKAMFLDGKYRYEIEAEIKAEAIKWVKHKENLYGIPILIGNYTAEDCKEATRRWIKHFFNITKEDLNET